MSLSPSVRRPGYGYGSQQTTTGAQFQYPPFNSSGVGETTAWSNGNESIAIIGGGYRTVNGDDDDDDDDNGNNSL